MKVLIVDEEPDVRKLVAMSFGMQQPTWEIIGAEDGPEALEQIERQQPDIVLLDVGLPEMSGFEVLKTIRLFSDVPVIMLTVRDDELSKVQGLELGADDYITKPFNPREVVVRVRTVLRRAGKEAVYSPTEIRSGDLVIDRRCHEVRMRGKVVKLTPTEFKLLEVLTGESGRAFTRLELLDRIFGYDFEGFERTVDVHVKNLRKKIESDPKQPTYVQTVYGVGYKFDGDLGED